MSQNQAKNYFIRFARVGKKGIVAKKKPRFDVIRAFICPVKLYLFAVIGNGVFMPLYGITVLGNKISFGVKPEEKVKKGR